MRARAGKRVWQIAHSIAFLSVGFCLCVPDLSSPLKKILSRLPAKIQPQGFAQEILGFEDYAATQQQQRRPPQESEEPYDAEEDGGAEEWEEEKQQQQLQS